MSSINHFLESILINLLKSNYKNLYDNCNYLILFNKVNCLLLSHKFLIYVLEYPHHSQILLIIYHFCSIILK